MARKRGFYKLQGDILGDWLHECRYGDFSVIGPRESDGMVLLIHRTERISAAYTMTASGLITNAAATDVDPREFGWRGAGSIG